MALSPPHITHQNRMETDVRVLLFARWITMNYGTPQYNVDVYDGNWWKEQLEHFNKDVYPNMIENGSVKRTKEFLNKNK